MDSIQSRLIKRAKEIMDSNWIDLGKRGFHQPAKGKYASFFAWDSGWHIIALSVLNPERAMKELETVLSYQREDGSIPHEIRVKELAKGEHLSRKIISYAVNNQYDEQGRSRMIDPPSYLIAAEILYRRTEDKRILDLLPRLKQSLDYYINHRDLLGNGLICTIHPWETGTDNAPYFDEVYGIHGTTLWHKIKYDLSYVRDINRLNKVAWDPKRAHGKGIFILQDVGLNGIVAKGAMALAELFRLCGDEVQMNACLDSAREIITACEKHLWDEERGYFYPRWVNADKLLYHTSLSGVAPLMTGMVDETKAKRIMESYFIGSNHFLTEWGVAYNSIKELGKKAHTNRDNMLWHGACQWINMSWIAARGASMYGYDDLARNITNRVMRLMDMQGFREYYHPLTGEGCGAIDFTWPALVVDMMETHGFHKNDNNECHQY